MLCYCLGEAPMIIEQPTSVHATYGERVAISVTVVDGENCQYQWYKDGSPLAEQRSPYLYLQNVSTSSNGSYHCVISNYYGVTNSNRAHLYVDISTKVKLPPSYHRTQPGGHPNYLYISSADKLSDYHSPLQDIYPCGIPRKESGDTSSLPSLDSLGGTHVFPSDRLSERMDALHLMEGNLLVNKSDFIVPVVICCCWCIKV